MNRKALPKNLNRNFAAYANTEIYCNELHHALSINIWQSYFLSRFPLLLSIFGHFEMDSIMSSLRVHIYWYAPLNGTLKGITTLPTKHLKIEIP